MSGRYIDIKAPDQCVTGRGGYTLRAVIHNGLGIVMFYPGKKGMGTLAYISGQDKGELSPENVINTLVKNLGATGKINEGLKFSLVSNGDSMSPEDMNKVVECIKKYEIIPTNEDLHGWLGGKEVSLNCSTGKVEINKQ